MGRKPWNCYDRATYVGQRVSIFVGGVGNNITKPAETTATEFVVIEDIAVTPSLGGTATTADGESARGLLSHDGVFGPRAYVQVRINTTDYFLDPDNIPNDGIPGSASPYPRSINFQPSFNLYPDVYVLPGQVWDALVTFYNGQTAFAGTDAAYGELQCFVKYTLYDGPDASSLTSCWRWESASTPVTWTGISVLSFRLRLEGENVR